MSEFSMTIGGSAVQGERSFAVVNPATGAPFAEAPDCTAARLDQAMEAAQGAFPRWRQDEEGRRRALREASRVVKAKAEMLARLLTREQGKPLRNSLDEITETSEFFQAVTEWTLLPRVLKENETARIELRRKPFGVTVAIVPWNFPVLLAAWKIGQALMAGNTMVLKPSPYTPLATLQMGQLLGSVFPPGVLNVVSGGNDLGAAMTAHPAARKISFTGSVATGKKIAQSAAPDLKHVTLELGGNDPAIVLGDVDPARIAGKMFWSAFHNNGQICIAIKRVYAHESVYKGLVAALTEMARGTKVGDGLQDGVQLGPLNNRMQFERVTSLVDDAKRSGARMEAGGGPRPGQGYFFEPTIVTDIHDGTRLVDEEQFGPALPIMPFRDLEDAIERANATHYGLGGSVWTSDTSRGADIVSRLECGTGWVNEHAALDPAVPFGGAKWSGMGHEFGALGLDSYTQAQVIRAART